MPIIRPKYPLYDQSYSQNHGVIYIWITNLAIFQPTYSQSQVSIYWLYYHHITNIWPDMQYMTKYITKIRLEITISQNVVIYDQLFNHGIPAPSFSIVKHMTMLFISIWPRIWQQVFCMSNSTTTTNDPYDQHYNYNTMRPQSKLIIEYVNSYWTQ